MQTNKSRTLSFHSQVGLLTLASAVGPLVAFVAYPVLTRVYDPAQFGVLGAFESILAISLSFCTLRYHLAIAVPEDDVEAAALVAVSVLASALIAVLMGVGLYWTAIYGFGLPRLHSIHVMWLLPVATFAGGVSLTLASWHARRGAFVQVAASRITQGVVQVAVQLSLGLLAMRTLGLVVGLVSARCSASAVLCGRTALIPLLRVVSRSRMAAAARAYRRLPLVSTWSAIVNIIGQQVSVLIIGFSFGVEAAGLYSLAFLVTVGPAHLVAQAIEQSFLARLRGAEREGQVSELAGEVFRLLLGVVAIPVAVFAAVAPDLFSLAFGEGWSPAGEYARYLAVSAFASIVGAHLPPVVVLRRWQRAELLFNLALAATRSAALIWGHYMGDPLVAIIAYSLSGALLTLTYSCGLLVTEGMTIRAVVIPVIRAIANGILAVMVLRAIGSVLAPAAVCGIGMGIALASVAIAVRRAKVGQPLAA